MDSDSAFEIVHTYDWYDGPRTGIADFDGAPHVFESTWRDLDDLEDLFLLSPIDDTIFTHAMERWAIWRRYETAHCRGEVAADQHPALPAERERYEQLSTVLEGKLDIDPNREIQRHAEFQTRKDSEWSGYGWHPLEVRWTEASESKNEVGGRSL